MYNNQEPEAEECEEADVAAPEEEAPLPPVADPEQLVPVQRVAIGVSIFMPHEIYSTMVQSVVDITRGYIPESAV